MSGLGVAAFASGLGTGMQQAQDISLRQAREERAKKAFTTDQAMKGIQLDRMEKEQPVLDKELQVRGAKADVDLSEQKFKSDMQDFEQTTRKLLAKKQQGQAGADVANQPDELAVAREDLNNKVLDASLRQTANLYRVAKLGDLGAATDLYNKSLLVEPGKKAKSISFAEMDAPQTATGGPAGPADTTTTTQKVPVLRIEDEKGNVRNIPRAQLEKLEEQFGATYQKVGNSIVRISRDGKATPVYEPSEAGANTETGDLYYKKGPKAGQIATPAAAAAGGLPRPGSKEATRIDDRVTKGRQVVDKYFGISEFTKLDEAAQPAYNSAVNRMGMLVRNGTDPEKAANQALLEQKDGRLNPDGTPKGAQAPGPAGGGGGAAQPALPKLW